jgi:predicted nucleic acid-binding protein
VSEPVFVDTNVFLYQWDASDPLKQRRAVDWLRRLADDHTGRVSFQVLAEFYVNATQKLRTPVPRARAQAYVRAVFAWKPVPIDVAVIDAAWREQERYKLSWWDALIVAAAQHAGCRTLLSEDFQAGQEFGDLTVVNPFATPPPDAP